MDDVGQNVTAPASAGSSVADQSDVTNQTQQQVQSTPSGKESAPVVTPAQTEMIGETAQEAKIATELQEVGVEASKGEVLQVPEDVAQAGVTPVGTAAPIPTGANVKFPLTEEKAKGILKMHKKVRDSISWLALLVIRQFQMIQIKNKRK